MSAFIFHGTDGYPEENWFPWMKKELEKLGIKTTVPQFLEADKPSLVKWSASFEPYEKEIGENTIILGHSLGATFLLRLLERIPGKIKAAFLVAVPIGVPPIKNWEGDQPFIGHPFDWVKIKKHAEQFFVYQSDDDPYVSIGNGETLAKNLGVLMNFIPHAGHFNAKAGYREFPELLEKIKTLHKK